jgi:hypothetical protein
MTHHLAHRRTLMNTNNRALCLLLFLALPALACTGPPGTVAPEAAPSPTATTTPTPAATPTPTPIPPTPTPLPAQTLLGPMNWQPQTYNNCLHCSTAIVLGYYDHWISQFDVNAQVHGGHYQCQIAAFLRQYQLTARIVGPPTREVLRRLLANGIPSLVLQMISPDWLTAHYRVLRGHDDEAATFIFDDPLQRLGAEYRIDYATYEELLRPFSHFIVVYPPEQEELVASLLHDLDLAETRCDPLRHTVALADLDDDGDSDAFVDGWAWRNDGSGSFTPERWWVGISHSLAFPALGDLDGDGDVDAFTANLGEPNTVWLNDGGGGFGDGVQELERISNCTGGALGDLDGDGDLDAIAITVGADRVWLNDGTGRFEGSRQRLGHDPSWNAALGDLDGDGDLDAFVACPLDGSVVWLNDGTGRFSPGDRSLGDGFDAALGDVDGDGDLDALVAHTGGDRVWLNDGSGEFTDDGRRQGESREVELGDVDGDGDLDAVCAAQSAVQVWWNDGTGTFGDGGPLLDGMEKAAIALADLDGDGDLDVLANSASAPVVWVNEGAFHTRE